MLHYVSLKYFEMLMNFNQCHMTHMVEMLFNKYDLTWFPSALNHEYILFAFFK